MEDKRKNLRRHIKAATDWLQQADKSIEQKDDLKGDLKLMLAKAELKNAEKHQNYSRINKILSIATAAAIAFGVLYFNNSKEIATEAPSTAKINVSSNVDESLAQPSSILTTKEKEMQVPLEDSIQTANVQSLVDEPDYIAPLDESNNYHVEVEEKISAESERYIEPEPIVEESAINVESTSVLPKEPDSISLEVRTPTEDMQKLMQSAGQILRAE